MRISKTGGRYRKLRCDRSHYCGPRALYRQINSGRQQLLAQPGTTVSAIQLFERLPEYPVITTLLVSRLLEFSKPTAGKAVDCQCSRPVRLVVGESNAAISLGHFDINVEVTESGHV